MHTSTDCKSHGRYVDVFRPVGTIVLMPSRDVCTWEPTCDRCSEGGAPLDAGSSASRAPFSLADGFLWEHTVMYVGQSSSNVSSSLHSDKKKSCSFASAQCLRMS